MINLKDIEAARARISTGIYLSPCPYTETLSRMTGCELYLKLENLQMTGSFKERGALNKILGLSEAQKTCGIIAASAGNHAQGVAHAAQVGGLKCTIVMPETTPLSKIRGTQELGAEIVLHGVGYDDASAKAAELQNAHGYTLIHAFDDDDVIAGQGAIGLELIEQVADLDVVVVPVGGGGLISGIAAVMKALKPEVRVIGVESERLPAMHDSLKAGKISSASMANTIADGIAVCKIGDRTFPMVQQYVDEMVTVSEEETAAAIMMLLDREKTLAEGAGAVGFAAIYNGKIDNLEGKKVVSILSGGNIDMNLLSRIIKRGLEHDGRLTELKVVLPDRPGSIARIASLIAKQGANIFDITQSQWVTDVKLGEREIVLQLETKGHDHSLTIIDALRKEGVLLK